jgi:lactam utilization protein B
LNTPVFNNRDCGTCPIRHRAVCSRCEQDELEALNAIKYYRSFEAGQPVIREFYADRDYDATGSIVFARKMRALDPAEVAAKCVRACREGKVRTIDGEDITIEFESICFHSDTPGALEIGTSVRKQLLENGVKIAPPSHTG